MQEAGASMVQLDFFYLPQPVCVARNATALTTLVTNLSHDLKIPIVPKLNIEIPAIFAAEVFRDTGIAGISFLDSVHVPPPILLDTGGRPAHRFVVKPSRASLFGTWQLPLTLHYTYLLSRFTTFPLCVGGGLMDSRDAIEIIMLGATAVQFATAILLHGYGRITEILRGIEEFLGQKRLDNVTALRGLAHQYLGGESETMFTTAQAKVDHDLCTRCDRCLELAFCTAIGLVDEHIQIIQSQCDGCGLCTFYCEAGALEVEVMP
jgi:Pyruvate/2-oxoacid:ferredoxin oxidoreductase delta subunit